MLDSRGRVGGDDTRVGVTVIDTRSGNVIDTVPVATPSGLALDPATGAVFVNSSGSRYSRLAVLTAPPTAGAPWPRTVRGGTPLPGYMGDQYRLGVDRDVWTLEVDQTTAPEATYSGRVTIDRGSFGDVSAVGLESDDTWTADRGTITFSTTNHSGQDGLRFTTPPAAATITFELEINGKPAPARQIFTGGLAQTAPSRSPVTFRRAAG